MQEIDAHRSELDTRLRSRIAWINKWLVGLLFLTAPWGNTSLAVLLLWLTGLVASVGGVVGLTRADSPTSERWSWGGLRTCLGERRERMKGWLALFLLAGSVSAFVNAGTSSEWLTLLGLVLVVPLVWKTDRIFRGLAEGDSRPFTFHVAGLFTVSGAVAACTGMGSALVQGYDRAHLPFAAENGYASLLVVVGGVGFGWLSRHRSHVVRLWGTVGFLIAVSGALIMTKSRGAWIGFAVMLLVMALFQRRFRWPALFIFAASVAVLWSLPAFQSRLASAFSLADNANRLHIWSVALEIIRSHPWFGVGPAQFGKAFDALKSLPMEASSAHNLVLTLWAEYGLFGLIGMVGLLGEVVRSQYRLARKGSPLWIGVFAATAGLLVHQMVDHTLFSFEMQGLFWSLAGWSLAAEMLYDQGTSANGS